MHIPSGNSASVKLDIEKLANLTAEEETLRVCPSMTSQQKSRLQAVAVSMDHDGGDATDAPPKSSLERQSSQGSSYKYDTPSASAHNQDDRFGQARPEAPSAALNTGLIVGLSVSASLAIVLLSICLLRYMHARRLATKDNTRQRQRSLAKLMIAVSVKGGLGFFYYFSSHYKQAKPPSFTHVHTNREEREEERRRGLTFTASVS